MAKVKAPLFSFGASGKLADSLVYFPWKGLNVVRQWVIPTNPKSDDQKAQRQYLKDVLPLLHDQMIDADDPFDKDDKAAYAILASLAVTPRTWFNALCKRWIDAGIKEQTSLFYAHQLATPAANQITYSAKMVKRTADTFPLSGTIYYGTTKTLMINTEPVATITDGAISQVITPLLPGTKYFFKFVPIEETLQTLAHSGIVTGIPAAA